MRDVKEGGSVPAQGCKLPLMLQGVRKGKGQIGLRRVPLSLVLLLAVFAGPALLSAQQPSLPAVARQKLTRELLQSRLSEVRQDVSLKDKEAVRERILNYYQDALKLLTVEEQFQQRIRQLEQWERNLPQLQSSAQRELERAIEPPSEEEAEGLTLEELRARLAAAENRKKQAEAEIRQWEEEKQLRNSRRSLLETRQAEVIKQLGVVRQALESKLPPGEPKEAVPAWRIRQQAEEQSLEAERTLLETESRVYPGTDSLIEDLLSAAQHRLKRESRAVRFWEQKIEEHRGTEAENQLTAATQLLLQLDEASLPGTIRTRLKKLAQQNLELALRRNGPQGTVVQLVQASREIDDVEQKLKRLEEDRRNLEQKLRIEGIEDYIGPELLNQRRKLPDEGSILRQIRQRTPRLSRIRLELLSLQERRDEYLADEGRLSALAGQIAGSEDAKWQGRIESFLKEIFRQRKEILKSLVDDYNSLLHQQSDLIAKERRLVDEARQVRELIDQHILWIPTTQPVGWHHLLQAGRALRWLLSPTNWQETLEVLWQALLQDALWSGLVVLVLIMFLSKTHVLRQRLRFVGEQANRGFTEPIRLTVEAFLLTAALAAVWPGVMWFVGWELTVSPQSTPFAEAVGYALQLAASILLTLDFLRLLLRPHGLADAHFRWKDARLQSLRRHVRWFTPLAVPGVFMLEVIRSFGHEGYATSLGRFVLMGLLLLGSLFLAILLRTGFLQSIPAEGQKEPTDKSLREPLHEAPPLQRKWWQWGVFLAAVFFPLILAATAGAGYLYTAELLTWKLLNTAWLSFTLILLHALGSRWLYHLRGRLALEQAQASSPPLAGEHQTKHPQEAETSSVPISTGAESAGETTSGDKTSGNSGLSATSTESDLATINLQTRRLLRLMIGLIGLTGLWLIWGEVLPALKILNVPLWSTQVETTRPVAGTKSTGSAQPVTTVRIFTLADVLLAVFVLGLVFAAASNLPGLLEVALLRRLPIDAGARYAITTLVRYLIYIVGIIAAFNLIGVGWTKVQWLVAALGVGLGFGLQEIFANFVAGVILLFERPLRVGDIVTIGEVTGRVIRIQIRATTVRSWDRQEYIVPNKELITGKLLNWTLSDDICRIVIKVGVKYGTDGDRARAVLMDVVRSHPDVMSDPQPRVTFEEFGDSSLNFIVRCCVPHIDKFLPTKHDLHAEIQRRFQAAGIEIPFPQRDLHLRSDETLNQSRPLVVELKNENKNESPEAS